MGQNFTAFDSFLEYPTLHPSANPTALPLRYIQNAFLLPPLLPSFSNLFISHLDCCESQHLSACFHPCLPTVYSQHSHQSESLKILYHTTPLLKHSTGFPFHSKVEPEVLSMAHGCVRLHYLPPYSPNNLPDLIYYHISSLLSLSHRSFLAVAGLHPTHSCLRPFPLPGTLFPG